MNSDAQESLMLRKQNNCGSGARSGTASRGEERRDGSSGESGKGHKRYLSLGEEEEDVDDGKEAEGFEILETMGARGDRENAQDRDRQRSESSLAFERALDAPSDPHDTFTNEVLNGNVFGIACSMESQMRAEKREVAPMWPLEEAGGNRRSLYDEDGFLKDGQKSPERVSCAIFQA